MLNKMNLNNLEVTLRGTPSLTDALKAADALGCVCKQITGTGDIIVTFGANERRERVNCRRKDAPKHFVMLLRQRLNKKIQHAR